MRTFSKVRIMLDSRGDEKIHPNILLMDRKPEDKLFETMDFPCFYGEMRDNKDPSRRKVREKIKEFLEVCPAIALEKQKKEMVDLCMISEKEEG